MHRYWPRLEQRSQPSVLAQLLQLWLATLRTSILLVENWDGAEGNRGEYKVYQVSSETALATDNFTDVTLVGTVDFGTNSGWSG
eukprot:GABW01002860.1.p3 GENE.GABW01002860.1~~GABW01002860.1.p3  ORF type:complete len:84 (-),score=5.22 GABW01002860.1:47-298(-)